MAKVFNDCKLLSEYEFTFLVLWILKVDYGVNCMNLGMNIGVCGDGSNAKVLLKHS